MLRRKFMQFVAACVPSAMSGWLPKAAVKPADPLTLFGLPVVENAELSAIGPIDLQMDRYLTCSVYVGKMVDGRRVWQKVKVQATVSGTGQYAGKIPSGIGTDERDYVSQVK